MTFVSHIFGSKKNSARCIDHHVKYPLAYSCRILMKTELFRLSFEKYTNIKFHENPPCGRRFVSCGRTDGPTWRN